MQIENLFAMLNELKYTVACNHANDCRARILSFNNEIKRKIRHDEEEFNDVLKAIDDYEKFCRTILITQITRPSLQLRTSRILIKKH